MCASSNIEEKFLKCEYDFEIHEQLYRNIFLLTQKYPTTKEFKECFKMDMFISSNAAAFKHIMHFLLNVYDPIKFKETVCWPVLDNKMESQFRNQVMKFINEIRRLHENSNIPQIMTSHLISPGGYKFTEFMFKFSTFILFEEINRNNSNTIPLLVHPVADGENASRQLQNLETIIKGQFKTLAHKRMKIETQISNIKDIVNNLEQEKLDLEQAEYDTKEKIKPFIAAEGTLKEELPSHEEEINIDKELTKIEDIIKCITECSNLIDVLNCNKQFNDNINFVEIVQQLRDTLDTNKYILYKIKHNNISNYLKAVQICEESKVICDKSITLISDLKEYTAKLEEMLQNSTCNVYQKNSVLSERVNEIFKPIDFTNFYDAD